MKMKLFILGMLALPLVAFADKPSQCALNSTCSFSIHGKFNKMLKTSGIQAGKKYVCNIVQGNGQLLSLQDVYVSKGVRYDLKGRRLNQAFIIYGPKTGTGVIQYTLHNHNDPWHSNSFQFKCVPAQ